MNNQLTILVVEDEPLLLEAIGKKLERENLQAELCKNGGEALTYLQKVEKLPDIIWLDYYLPDMNGLAFVAKLKENSKWKNIPVIVVSNSATTNKVNNMLALGIKKYILKAEYRLEDIVKLIRDFV